MNGRTVRVDNELEGENTVFVQTANTSAVVAKNKHGWNVRAYNGEGDMIVVPLEDSQIGEIVKFIKENGEFHNVPRETADYDHLLKVAGACARRLMKTEHKEILKTTDFKELARLTMERITQ